MASSPPHRRQPGWSSLFQHTQERRPKSFGLLRAHTGKAFQVGQVSRAALCDVAQSGSIAAKEFPSAAFAAGQFQLRHLQLVINRPGLAPGQFAARRVRFRTLGCSPLPGALASGAATVPEIIEELVAVRTSERQGRVIDHDQSGSMEKKKQEGYF